MNASHVVMAVVIPALALGLVAAPAAAAPIGTQNLRPVPVTGSALQTVLDEYVYPPGILSATTDQQPAGYWKFSGLVAAMKFTVLSESAGYNAPFNTFGFWSDLNGDTDGEGRTMVDIFTGAAGPMASVSVVFTDQSTIRIDGGGPDEAINRGVFSGIDQFGFGFYLKGPSGMAWTMDTLNYSGDPQALAFHGSGDGQSWLLAFEDLPLGLGGDGEYDAMVVRVGLMEPVPEPATVLLLGSGLAGLGAAGWRKRSKGKTP